MGVFVDLTTLSCHLNLSAYVLLAILDDSVILVSKGQTNTLLYSVSYGIIVLLNRYNVYANCHRKNCILELS